jgi:hypothetical protein
MRRIVNVMSASYRQRCAAMAAVVLIARRPRQDHGEWRARA